jgi:hypothetical protein
VKNTNLTEGNLLADEVDVNLDMLRTTVLDGIAGHVDRTDVVTEDNSSRVKRAMKLEKKLSKPAALSHDMCDGSILCLGARPRNRGLTFGGPRDQVVTKIYTIAGGRSSSVRAASPVGVRVRSDGRRRCRVQLKTEVQCPLEVAKNPLDEVQMRLTRSMHVETCLLNGMCYVRTRQSEVLKSTGKAPILCGVGDEGTIIGREFTTHVNGSRTRVALKHAGTMKKIDDVLALREHHASGRASHRDAEEVGELAEVSHGELAVEELGDMAKKTGAGGGENDVVHIEQEVSDLVSSSKNEEGDITLCSDEPETVRVVSEALVPGPRGMLEAVERLMKFADMLGKRFVDEARGLLAVDLLVKVAMK